MVTVRTSKCGSVWVTTNVMVSLRTSKCGSVWVTTNVMVSENPEMWVCVGDYECNGV